MARRFVSPNDIRWGELNRQVSEAMKNSDWATMKGCYNEMAYIVAKEGKEAQHLIKERNKCELNRLKKEGITTKVEILIGDIETSCKYCISLEGKILTIDEALKTMPIPGDCLNDVFGTGHSFCRCNYLPIID